ncbi:MAG TPA: hypothetical protein PLD84_07225 [Chitinophagales bacterium]|nr:hypothetical protein [Chitinophagales bacterium]
MIIVSEKSIDATEAFFEVLTEKEASEISIRFAVEQPYLLIYLQSMSAIEDEEAEEEEEDDDESDALTDNPLTEELSYYAMFIWKAFELEAGKISLITEQEIEEQSDASMLEMQNLLEVSAGGDPETIAKQFEKMRQPFLITYLLASFFGDVSDEDFDEDFEDEEANYLFLICNQLIMMIDEKVNGGSKLKVVR